MSTSRCIIVAGEIHERNCVHTLRPDTCEVSEEKSRNWAAHPDLTELTVNESRSSHRHARSYTWPTERFISKVIKTVRFIWGETARLTAPVCVLSCSRRRHWRVKVAPQSACAQLNNCWRGTASSFFTICSFIMIQNSYLTSLLSRLVSRYSKKRRVNELSFNSSSNPADTCTLLR